MTELRNVRFEDGAIRADVDMGRVEAGARIDMDEMLRDATLPPDATAEERRLLALIRKVYAGLADPMVVVAPIAYEPSQFAIDVVIGAADRDVDA